MSTITYGRAPHEQLAISMAKRLGKDEISIPVCVAVAPDEFVATTFCGTCGRIIHHPDCPRAKGSE